MEDEEIRGVVQISWNIGGLHYSQKQDVFSPITTKSDFIAVSDTNKSVKKFR